MIAKADITGLILAGGLGRRMSADGNGTNKALQPFDGRPLIVHAIARLQPQVGRLVLNVNQDAGRFAHFGLPLVPDEFVGFAGPLAGLHAGMKVARTPWIVICPCDAPFLPDDLVSRLASALVVDRHDLAVARSGRRSQSVFALVAVRLRDDLEQWLADGGRKVEAWQARLRTIEVDFDDAHAFRNINTMADLESNQSPGGQVSHSTGGQVSHSTVRSSGDE